MHGFPGTDTIVEEDGHIGHGAVLHGCIVQRNALVGMNAVVNDNAVDRRVGDRRGDGVRQGGHGRAAAHARRPACRRKIVRELTDTELAWKIEGTQSYQELTRRSLATMQATAPLERVEPDRKRLELPELLPLSS